MDEEIWKDIVDYEGLYQVSNMGRVKSLYDGGHKIFREKILKSGKSGNGYLSVKLCKDGKRKRYYIHRLVLSTFNPVENMENLEVNHINENKGKNYLSNLEWTTHKDNVNHGTRNKRMVEKLRGRTFSEEHKRRISKSHNIPIVQIDLATNKIVNVWCSSRDAERKDKFNPSNITQCCKNKYYKEGNNIYSGYKWQYLHEYISKIDPRIKKVILFDKDYKF